MLPNLQFSAQSGDISKVASDALITAINSAKMWAGGIDHVIYRCAGRAFHNQPGSLNLVDGQVIFARGSDPSLCFKNVIFVVDDLCLPLSEIVFRGLVAADDYKLTTVTLPTIRMGVMLGKVEKTVEEALDQMVDGCRRYKAQARHLEDVTFVIYGDPETQKLLDQKLKTLD